MAEEVVRWRPVEPLPAINGDTQKMLDLVDELRKAWERYLAIVSPEVFEEARQRNLRRHAIETGIIERLYDVDWGITQALVAEGITASAAAREGAISDDTLATINSQLDALELMVEVAGAGRPLTTSLVKELHAAITRTQTTYEARDQFGRTFGRTMVHGAWKTNRNDVRRADGSLLEFAPPEHVDAEMDELLRVYTTTATAHPVVRAAWLHHRFVRIHPFQDGNGRVARALTLLVLLEARYAPLVVDREQRGDYLEALDAANDGDLRPLVRLFAGLEIVALKSELSPQLSSGGTTSGGAVAVARTMVVRLQERRQADDEVRRVASEQLAADLQLLVVAELTTLGDQLRDEFRVLDRDAWGNTRHAAPGDERARHWRGPLVRVARQVGFFANLADGSWWTALHLHVRGQTLRYLIAIQKVGHADLGVLAVTTFAEVLIDRPTGPRDDRDPDEGDQDNPPEFRHAFDSTAADSITLVPTDNAQDRWPEVSGLIERTLAAGIRYYADEIG